jgi:hypothetical protein
VIWSGKRFFFLGRNLVCLIQQLGTVDVFQQPKWCALTVGGEESIVAATAIQERVMFLTKMVIGL